MRHCHGCSFIRFVARLIGCGISDGVDAVLLARNLNDAAAVPIAASMSPRPVSG